MSESAAWRRALRRLFVRRCRYCERNVFAPLGAASMIHNFGTCLLGLRPDEVDRRLAAGWKPEPYRPRVHPFGTEVVTAAYHPDAAIDAEIVADALDAECADLAAGYAPRFWRCPGCGAGHSRGHFQTIGVHRCLGCGYVGTGGTTHPHVDGRRLA